MGNFKINFELQKLEKVMLWGAEPSFSIHWFGLTDGLLWIDAGEQTVYEYSEEAQRYFEGHSRYNDYQIVRFLEDFSETFPYISESVPKELYDSIETFDAETEQWKKLHIDEPDEVFDAFYFEAFCELIEWKVNRSFDSGHLVGGPYIGCFRHGDKIKFIWESSYCLESGQSIWTAPCGCCEMSYAEFAASVKNFFEEFFAAMDIQVEQALKKDWGTVSLDKKRLEEENRERKEYFYQQISFLEKNVQHTDWNQVKMLYKRMKAELEKSSQQ